MHNNEFCFPLKKMNFAWKILMWNLIKDTQPFSWPYRKKNVVNLSKKNKIITLFLVFVFFEREYNYFF